MKKTEMLEMAMKLRFAETNQDNCGRGKHKKFHHNGFTICPFATDELYKVIVRLEA